MIVWLASVLQLNSSEELEGPTGYETDPGNECDDRPLATRRKAVVDEIVAGFNGFFRDQ